MKAGQAQPEQTRSGLANQTFKRGFLRNSLRQSLLVLCVVLLISGTIRETPLAAAEPANPLVDEISLTFHTVTGGPTLGGSGTGVASLSFGTVSAFGAVDEGVNRTLSAGNLTINSPFGIKVQLTSGASSSYTLNAALAMSDGTTFWTFGDYTLTTSPQTVATGQPYGGIIQHRLSLTVPFNSAARTINNSIDILAVAD